MTILRDSLLILFITTLVGCAGRMVDRPQENFFQLGETTENQVIETLGSPTSNNEIEVRGKKVKILLYGYALETTARAIVCYFMDEVLVGHYFTSAFSGESTDFDLTKVGNLVENRSTRQNVESALGEPSGEAIYPFIEDPEGLVMWYRFHGHTVNKKANFELDSDSVVRHFSVEFE